jgi:hypothetical protein
MIHIYYCWCIFLPFTFPFLMFPFLLSSYNFAQDCIKQTHHSMLTVEQTCTIIMNATTPSWFELDKANKYLLCGAALCKVLNSKKINPFNRQNNNSNNNNKNNNNNNNNNRHKHDDYYDSKRSYQI